MRKIFSIILVLLILTGGSIFLLDRTGKVSATELMNKLTQIIPVKQDRWQPLADDAQVQVENLSSRAQDVAEHSQKVLGDSIQVNNQESDKNLGEKAIDYGRYLYCKQVVTDFESRQ